MSLPGVDDLLTLFNSIGILKLLLSTLLAYTILSSIHAVWFSPLSQYPGPRIYAISKIPITYHRITGSIVKHLAYLHEVYGPVVRIGPSELSYIDPRAWNDIYGFKNASLGRQMPKDALFYDLDTSKDGTNIDADLDDRSHGRQRKIFSHAFSDRALRQQEGLIATYVDRFVEKIKIAASQDRAVDLVKILNFTTFDIMSDLTFGEPLDLLEKNEYHEWVAAIFDNLHAIAALQGFMQFSWFRFSFDKFLPQSLKAQRDKHRQFTRERVDARLTKPTTRPDIWSLVIGANASSPDAAEHVRKEEMYDNAGLFMIAGTETTATLLSGLMYLLMTNKGKMSKLQDEVRNLSADQLNLLELPKLSYLHACIEEGLRVYPPVPIGLPRRTPAGGAIICDRFVPGNVSAFRLCARLICTERSRRHLSYRPGPCMRCTALTANFNMPEDFVPERWLPSLESLATAKKDERKAFNPFLIGPRNCLGKNLAYHEMRLILAKLIWNFDFELIDDNGRWMDQRVLLFWDKKPLRVRTNTATT